MVWFMISDSNTSPVYEVYYLGGLDNSKVVRLVLFGPTADLNLKEFLKENILSLIILPILSSNKQISKVSYVTPLLNKPIVWGVICP